MKRNFTTLSMFALMSSAFAGNKSETANPGLKMGNYGLSGWTGFTGSNQNKPKHFNKRRHGKSLRKKHKKLNK